MAELQNPRHEQFCQLISTGYTPARAYVAAGYSEKTAYTSGPRLLKAPAARARIAELQQSVAQSVVSRAAIDRNWVFSALRKMAENAASESVRVRALELIGKELGMFVEPRAIPWNGDLDLLTEEQLPVVLDSILRLEYGDDPTAIEAARKQLMIEAEAKVETR